MGTTKATTVTKAFGEDEEKRRRQAATVRDVVEHVSHEPCSVEFSRDAKQTPRWTIKAYSERADLGKLVDEVMAIDAKLTGRTRVGEPARSKAGDGEDDGG